MFLLKGVYCTYSSSTEQKTRDKYRMKFYSHQSSKAVHSTGIAFYDPGPILTNNALNIVFVVVVHYHWGCSCMSVYLRKEIIHLTYCKYDHKRVINVINQKVLAV